MANIDRRTFAIWGSPNSGKTTLAVNMAVVLADSGYMTCLVSASDHGELQSFFGVSIPKNKGLYAAISSGRNVREALTLARPNLCILELDTGGDAYDMANITPTQVQNMLEELSDQFSFVIIDCTNYKESVFTGLGLVAANKVIVCIPHRATAATWHIANKQMLDALEPKSFYVDANTREGGCDMDQLLATIDLPECDVKLGCVDSAYRCENCSSPIVLQRGSAEKKYKKAVLSLIQTILEIESNERAQAKRNKRLKREGVEPEKKKGLKPVRGEGVRKKKLSKRAQRKAEEEAMRRARDMDYDDEYYDDDEEDDDD